MEEEKVVIILSGGMDSTTLLYDVVKKYGKENVFALSFNYNQKHRKELVYAKKSCNLLGVHQKTLNLRLLNTVAPSCLTRDDWKVPEGHYESENMKQTVVPNRNMVMLSLATAYAIGIGAKKLFYGAHSGDHAIYPDCRPEFIEKMKDVIRICDWTSIELVAPYFNIDKGDIAIKGQSLGVDYSLTWTCYKGKRNPCKESFCGACSERILAFEKAGYPDPLYKSSDWGKIVKKVHDGQKK